MQKGFPTVTIDQADPSPTSRNRFDRMHAALRAQICLLDYAPGTRLSEDALAATFGVSRTPVRRVLARLEAEGLVQSVHGVGTFVTDVEVAQLRQTYLLRLELAELIGKLDAVVPDDALWVQLRALSARATELLKEPSARRFAELNMDFFLALLNLTSNAPLRAICERLYFQTTRIWLKSVFSSHLDLSDEITLFHREVQDILRALELGDLHAATLIQRAHISMSFKRLCQGIVPV